MGPTEQRRGRRIAMTADELDAFLAEERTCRVATSSAHGVHNSPLWFLWHDGALWLSSIVKSQRWLDLQRDPRVSVVVDAGHSYEELRGVELLGSVRAVGEVPRTGEAVAELAEVEPRHARKYRASDVMTYDGRHAWLRLVPDKIVSWDFRKLYEPVPDARAWAEQYVATVNAGRYEDLGALFALDAVMLPPTGDERLGREAIAAFYRGYLPTIRPQVRIASFLGDGAEAMFALAAVVGERKEERLGAVDHVTVGPDGLATRLVIFTRP